VISLLLFCAIVFSGYHYLLKLLPFHDTSINLALSGSELSEAEARELEKQVENNPDDISSRTRLLGFYFLKQTESETIRKLRGAHILWFIKNRPDSELAGTPYVQIDEVSDPVYGEAKQSWLEQVQKDPSDSKILENAANFFTLTDKSESESLLIKGYEIEPSNYNWPNKLGDLYSLQHEFGKAFEQYEKAYGLPLNEFQKLSLLQELSKTAVEAGDLVKAKTYAKELLTDAENSKFKWTNLEDLHDGNMVLGRVALRSGDLEGAKQYLLKAGEAPGSGNYSAFGPNMSLAKDLLEKGETQTVLQYFELCSHFWKNKKQLDAWTATVKDGKIPNFCGNLRY
jgi:tetratricopeptide (TPR) repeat protein